MDIVVVTVLAVIILQDITRTKHCIGVFADECILLL